MGEREEVRRFSSCSSSFRALFFSSSFDFLFFFFRNSLLFLQATSFFFLSLVHPKNRMKKKDSVQFILLLSPPLSPLSSRR